MVVVGNKSDLFTEATVSEDEGRKFAKQHEAIFANTSCKTGEGVKEMFEEAYEEMLSSNWKDVTVLDAYKKVMEYIKSVYEMAENGEIMDNDCPITITLTI